MSFHAEGTLEYDALLFIPSRAPFALYSKDYEKVLALYSSNVLIQDKCAELLPDYYNFVRGLLFIPSRAPFALYSKDYEKVLALYSSNVLIQDKCAELLPDYYNFVRGVVDSQDVSLNISRETLQHDRQLVRPVQQGLREGSRALQLQRLDPGQVRRAAARLLQLRARCGGFPGRLA